MTAGSFCLRSVDSTFIALLLLISWRGSCIRLFSSISRSSSSSSFRHFRAYESCCGLHMESVTLFCGADSLLLYIWGVRSSFSSESCSIMLSKLGKFFAGFGTKFRELLNAKILLCWFCDIVRFLCVGGGLIMEFIYYIIIILERPSLSNFLPSEPVI